MEKKLLSYNWKLNFLYSGGNYNKLYEWEKHNWTWNRWNCYVLSLESKGFEMF
jgi:hypothetical protein